MEKISFDDGIREYSLNGLGVLRFNPSDPALYQRVLEMEEKFRQLEESMTRRLEGGMPMPQAVREADRELKALLSWVFGGDNDFAGILSGVNLLATAQNGRQVAENLLDALGPILEKGAESLVRQKVTEAREKAQLRRENQR